MFVPLSQMNRSTPQRKPSMLAQKDEEEARKRLVASTAKPKPVAPMVLGATQKPIARPAAAPAPASSGGGINVTGDRRGEETSPSNKVPSSAPPPNTTMTGFAINPHPPSDSDPPASPTRSPILLPHIGGYKPNPSASGSLSDLVTGGEFVSGVRGPVQPPTTDDEIDQMIRDFVEGQLSSADDVDTSKEEALINEKMGDEIGASLVDARARGGRSGFQSSGAQFAIEGDLERKARQQATEDILGVRNERERQAKGDALDAIAAEQGMREAAANEFVNQKLLELLGIDPEEPAAESPGGVPAPDPIKDAVDKYNEEKSGVIATSGGARQSISSTSQLPPDAKYIGTDKNGNKLYYSEKEKHQYVIE